MFGIIPCVKFLPPVAGYVVSYYEEEPGRWRLIFSFFRIYLFVDTTGDGWQFQCNRFEAVFRLGSLPFLQFAVWLTGLGIGSGKFIKGQIFGFTLITGIIVVWEL